MRFVKTLILGITLATAVPGLHGQATPASGPGKTAATPAATAKAAPPAAKPTAATAQAANAPAGQAKPATPATNKPAPPVTKPAAPAAGAKPAAQTPKAPATTAKPAAKPAAKKTSPKPKPAGASGTSTPATDKEIRVAKRDPFESLVGHEQASVGKTGPMPPGKAGLQVSTLRLDGIVRAPTGMIAVVSNPQLRTYFLREGDQLYDGRVEKIAMDGVSFHEIGKDAFGKPVERQVNKRIYASAGEQQ